MLRLQSPLPERYTTASGDELATMIGAAKAALGPRLFVLGHHYQRDDVMRWADARGDSFGLSRMAAEVTEAEFIVFCGVHFMAESADVLTGAHQQVLLPDLNAGCSMADMADIEQVEEAWEELGRVTDVSRIIPITYMNSSAALKAFVGRHCGRGLHLLERPGRADLGSRSGAGRQGAVLPGPASWSQHRRTNSGTAPTTCGSGTRGWPWAGSATSRSSPPPCSCGRATARCTSASGPSTWRPSGPRTLPVGARDGPPRVRPRRRGDGRPGGLDRQPDPRRGRRTLGVGDRRSPPKSTS